MTELERAANDFAFKNHSWLKNALPTITAVESFERGAKWREKNLWHDAQGDDLPEIDREVIVLCNDGFKGYKVCFAHRPFAEGYDVKNLDGKVLDHITPRIYGKGGWSIPNVKWWLDADMPKEDEK